jgi:hypothetical protein
MVYRMADDYVDPSGSTEQFRAFVQDSAAAPQKKSRAGLIAGIVVAVLILAGLAWLAFS